MIASQLSRLRDRVRRTIPEPEKYPTGLANQQGKDNRCVIHSVNNSIQDVAVVSVNPPVEHPLLELRMIAGQIVPYLNAFGLVKERKPTQATNPDQFGAAGFPQDLIPELLRELGLVAIPQNGVPEFTRQILYPHLVEAADFARIGFFIQDLKCFGALISMAKEGSAKGHVIAMRQYPQGSYFRIQDSDPATGKTTEHPRLMWNGNPQDFLLTCSTELTSVGSYWRVAEWRVTKIWFLRIAEGVIPVGTPTPPAAPPPPPAAPPPPPPPPPPPRLGGGKKKPFR